MGIIDKLRNFFNEPVSNNPGQRRDVTGESLEEAKWTGKKPKGLTNYEFDRLQRDEAR